MTAGGSTVFRRSRFSAISESNEIKLLWLLAIAVVATTLAVPTAFQFWGDHGYMAVAPATGFAALLATTIAERAPARHALWLIVAVGLVLRCILLFTEPLLSTDIYRYIWDGCVQAAGINPYRYIPAHEALAALRDAAIYPNINRAFSHKSPSLFFLVGEHHRGKQEI